MNNLWGGAVAETAKALNSSIAVDSRMWREDIQGSLAHSAMLTAQGILSPEDGQAIQEGLTGILNDIESGALQIDMGAEDIHTFVEMELTARIGDAGKRLHTARSRNDQVATDLRLYLRNQEDELLSLIHDVIKALRDKAAEYADAVMPGYTHLQRAQPVTLGHYLCAYAMMLTRDAGRIKDARTRLNQCPLGACALAGTTFPTDRSMTAAALGFDGPCLNSMDAVSDRDFCVELMSACSLIMTHLSRLSEELVLWSSLEFGFVTLPEGFVTGSSIMPQKKNPDMAELIRGKTGRVYGDLTALLTVLKGLPLAYNKDMQEDKQAVFDAVDTAKLCLSVMAPMVAGMTPHPEAMRKAAGTGFINATDCADWLVAHGVPFREAYGIAAGLVHAGTPLEEVSIQTYQAACPVFDESIYDAVDLDNCVRRRNLPVADEIAFLDEFLAKN
ncbi:MAG: argininosuccinate lyase [Oscillospiraceae bacterium]|nr:argininosuccinate lyase [Oscillospiraceae bacterium]